MAEVYKILGQIATTDTSEQILYTAPASTQAIVTNITAVNRTSSAQTFDVNVYSSAPSVAAVATPTFAAITRNATSAATSTNGITWTLRTMPAIKYWSSVAYGNGVFAAVVVGSTSAASSTDGITWTLRTLPAFDSWYSVTYGNGVFAAVASSSTSAASSTDGITWTLRTMPSSASWYSVTCGNPTESARLLQTL